MDREDRIAALERQVASLTAQVAELTAGRRQRNKLPKEVADAMALHGHKLKGPMTTACVANAIGLPVTRAVQSVIGRRFRQMGILPTTTKGHRFFWLDGVN